MPVPNMGALVFRVGVVALVVDILLVVGSEAAQLHRLSAEIFVTLFFRCFHATKLRFFVFKQINIPNYTKKLAENPKRIEILLKFEPISRNCWRAHLKSDAIYTNTNCLFVSNVIKYRGASFRPEVGYTTQASVTGWISCLRKVGTFGTV